MFISFQKSSSSMQGKRITKWWTPTPPGCHTFVYLAVHFQLMATYCVCGSKETHTTHKIPRDEEHIATPKDIRRFPLKVSTFWVWHYSTKFLDFQGNKASSMVDTLCSSAPINCCLSLQFNSNIVPTEATTLDPTSLFFNSVPSKSATVLISEDRP